MSDYIRKIQKRATSSKHYSERKKQELTYIITKLNTKR